MKINKPVAVYAVVNEQLRNELRTNTQQQIATLEGQIQQLRTQENRAVLSAPGDMAAQQVMRQAAAGEQQLKNQIAGLTNAATEIVALQDGTLYQIGVAQAIVEVGVGDSVEILTQPGYIVCEGSTIVRVGENWMPGAGMPIADAEADPRVIDLEAARKRLQLAAKNSE